PLGPGRARASSGAPAHSASSGRIDAGDGAALSSGGRLARHHVEDVAETGGAERCGERGVPEARGGGHAAAVLEPVGHALIGELPIPRASNPAAFAAATNEPVAQPTSRSAPWRPRSSASSTSCRAAWKSLASLDALVKYSAP